MSDFDNNFNDYDYSSANANYAVGEMKTPTLAVVALILSIVAVLISLIACCCIPILFGGLGLLLSIIALVLNFVAGSGMKAQYGETNGFVKITRVVEIIIVVLMVIGIVIDVVATIINVKNAMDPNSTYNQLIQQLTGGIALLK
ncbi:MAG: hypothetical protein J5825_07225 [Lachnospiraceae bacterium]|nr:hypothetical protein [Lachnospiraceae bacterium]